MHAAAAVVGRDALSAAVAEELSHRGIQVLRTDGAELADMQLSLDDAQLELQGHTVGAMVVREPVRAIAPLQFVEQDRTFVLAEVSATLLAASNQPRVLAINRLDAESWFEDGEWPVWRRQLRRAGVAVTPMSFGDCDDGAYWRPYVGGVERPVPTVEVRRSLGTALGQGREAGAALCVFEEIFDESASPDVARAGRLMSDSGVQLKSISYDEQGRVVGVDPLPAVPDTLLEPVAARVAAAVHGHLRRW